MVLDGEKAKRGLDVVPAQAGTPVIKQSLPPSRQ